MRYKMHIRYKNNYIGILIIIAMLLSGMCQAELPTDSLFASRQVQPLHSVYSSIGKLPDSPVLCTEELLGKPVLLTTIRRTGQTDRTWRNRISGFITGIPLCPLQSDPLTLTARSRTVYQFFSITVILQYIHHQDGQKS